MSDSRRFADHLVFSIVIGSAITGVLGWLLELRGNLVFLLLVLSIGAVYIYLGASAAEEKNKHVRREFEERKREKDRK